MDVREINVLVLAYLGDTIYENYVRKYLVLSGIGHVDALQKKSVQYVSAKAQSKFLKEMMAMDFFTDDEIDIITYKYATGLEALIGYLDLKDKKERIDKIMSFILK